MAKSSTSQSLSNAEEPRHDDSLLASLNLPTKSLMPRPNTTSHEQSDDPPRPMEKAKPRGRPKGSKNKPKYLPQPEPTIKTHILEIQPGSDIVEMIHYFARTQKAGVSVVNGVGRVRNVMVRNPVAHEPSIILGGAHEILSINGMRVGPAKVKQESVQQSSQDGSGGGSYSYFSGAQSSYLIVQLAGPRGAVWGGVVTGKLVAASNVLLNVSTFANYEFHRLSPDDLDPNHQNTSTSGGGSSEGDPDQLGLVPSSSAIIGVDDGLNWDPTPTMVARKRTRVSKF